VAAQIIVASATASRPFRDATITAGSGRVATAGARNKDFGKRSESIVILAFAKVAGHHIITWLIIGLVAGLVASRVVRGTGLGMVRDILVGLVGAVIGGLILHAVRGGSHASPSVLIEIVVAFVGAVILLIIAKAMDRKRV
jgi:uncharacterized membrane protein YeaQ/YmgE (transglycosylase-associated protein family)